MRFGILLLLVLAAGCVGSPDETSLPTGASTTIQVVTTLTEGSVTTDSSAERNLHIEGLHSAKGSFVVENTDPEIPAVGIESIDVTIEWRVGNAVWEVADATCTTEPASPLVVESAQGFDFDCSWSTPLVDGAQVRAVAAVGVFGSDEPVTVVVGGS